MIKYSVLSTDQSFLSNSAGLSELLSQGIKILAFGQESFLSALKTKYKIFIESKLLQTFPLLSTTENLTIHDGLLDQNSSRKLALLSKKAPGFNYEQYLIEHADPYNNIIVEAGAGTGKTTVMIDRILFLLHTVPGLTLENIGMITFTNEATQNMKHKIQGILMERYLATKSPLYLRFLEDSAKIQIQTIHSFSKDIINELGASIGYASSINLKSFKYQKSQIIHDVLNQEFQGSSKTVAKSLGASLHDLDKLILEFWAQLENIGLTDQEIASLDWGEPIDPESQPLHHTISTSFPVLNERYNSLKMDEDSIAVGDIVRELRRILDTGAEADIKCKKLKYLFVDEFQDSDNAQIKTIAWLQKRLGLQLFTVGDVKQSIYRFRGAVDTAFVKLKKLLVENNELSPNEFTLIRNYRTSQDILCALDPIFRGWEREKLLDYGKSLSAQKRHEGVFHLKRVRNAENTYAKEAVHLLTELLADCARDAEENGTQMSTSQHVTVLTRTNYQLSKVGDWCRNAHIPCYIRKEGTFYSCQAVRDFYCLIKANLFPSSPSCLFDYLNSAYSTTDCSAEDASSKYPGSQEQISYFLSLAEEQGLSCWQKEFRLKPVLSVLRKIVNEKKPAERFIAKRKQILQSRDQWEESDINHQLAIEAAQYEADLEKLLEIIRRNFSGQMVSLYQIFNYLQIQFLTNKAEDEPDISGEMGCNCVYGMTVHKAKGLEFDTVFLPLTQREFRKEIDTELLLDESFDPPKVGWSRVQFGPGWNEVASQQCNTHYKSCLQKEFSDVDREEARLLYVALTRSIRRLECFVIGSNEHSWAHMLEV